MRCYALRFFDDGAKSVAAEIFEQDLRGIASLAGEVAEWYIIARDDRHFGTVDSNCTGVSTTVREYKQS